MYDLILCVILNSFIGVIFKLFEKFKIDNFQAIVTNYLVCVCTASVVSWGNPLPASMITQPWFVYAVLLGLMFILVFNVTALAVQKSGIMLATIFQKMSLIAPALLAIFIFHERSNIGKWMGILLAIFSILLLSYGSTKKSKNSFSFSKSFLLYPLLTFLGSCVIDSAIYLIQNQGYVTDGDVGFVSTLFLCAGLWGTIYLAYQVFLGQTKLKWKNIIAGICLGVPNFFSIYLLFAALRQGIEGSVVFPVNNAGVLLLSSMYGIILFQEKINFIKSIGFIMSVVAILLIANA